MNISEEISEYTVHRSTVTTLDHQTPGKHKLKIKGNRNGGPSRQVTNGETLKVTHG